MIFLFPSFGASFVNGIKIHRVLPVFPVLTGNVNLRCLPQRGKLYYNGGERRNPYVE